MKSLIYKIAAIFGVIFTIFQLGKRNGKTALKNEINENNLKNVKTAQQNNKVNLNLSRDDLIDKLSK